MGDMGGEYLFDDLSFIASTSISLVEELLDILRIAATSSLDEPTKAAISVGVLPALSAATTKYFVPVGGWITSKPVNGTSSILLECCQLSRVEEMMICYRLSVRMFDNIKLCDASIIICASFQQ